MSQLPSINIYFIKIYKNAETRLEHVAQILTKNTLHTNLYMRHRVDVQKLRNEEVKGILMKF